MSKKTIDNLKAAYAGESQARNNYTFWAGVARKEGWLEVAEYFEETAANEKEHAEQILKLLNGINGTEKNLQAAVENESFEYEDMYVEFEKVAREEGEEEAAELFKALQKVEKHHAERFAQLLELLKQGKLLYKDQPVKWKCRECGYIYEGNEPPEECPLCKHPKKYYRPLVE
ncbi:rubrerythrin family protein [Desulfofalx alkaliphila]|uniref:rubrerythrin family protein n=1 Tax=Desulfofalx alkaliphila TaxID=105483 RepID=UPI0004E15F48|nr:rubrerythrin family protein [Desulfofalx alkaliphila]